MKIGIIGGGPAGYLGALKASILGLDVTLFEKDKIGGVCVNEGCIPVKSLIKIVSNIENLNKVKNKGIRFSNIDYNLDEMLKTVQISTKRLQGGINLLLKKRNVNFINKKAELVSTDTVLCDDKEYRFDKILLSTGSIPKKPPFKTTDFWTSTDALYSKYIPNSIGIIGGGVIGLEFAYIYRNLGVNVSIFEIMDEILPNEDREFSSILRKEFEKMGVKFFLKTNIIEIKDREEKKEVIFYDGKENTLLFDKVLISVGRELSREGIPDFINIEKGFIKVDHYLNTGVKNIYAAGDCIGGYMLAHTAYYEAEIAIGNMIGNSKKYDESVVPRVVYTKPEYAACGETEENLLRKGIKYKKEIFMFSSNGRAVAEDRTYGGVKILFDENEYILGGVIVGESASELITIISLLIKEKIKLKNSIDLIFPHPTYSEGIKEVLLKSIGLPLHSLD